MSVALELEKFLGLKIYIASPIRTFTTKYIKRKNKRFDQKVRSYSWTTFLKDDQVIRSGDSIHMNEATAIKTLTVLIQQNIMRTQKPEITTTKEHDSTKFKVEYSIPMPKPMSIAGLRFDVY